MYSYKPRCLQGYKALISYTVSSVHCKYTAQNNGHLGLLNDTVQYLAKGIVQVTQRCCLWLQECVDN